MIFFQIWKEIESFYGYQLQGAILLYRLQYYCQFHRFLLYKELPQEEISGGFPRYIQLHFLSCLQYLQSMAHPDPDSYDQEGS